MVNIRASRGVYVGFCVLVSFVFLVLLSNGVGFTENMSLKSVAEDPLMEGDVVATDIGYVLNDNAGTFVHLSEAASLVLLITMLLGVMVVTVIGVRERSILRTFAPSGIFVIVSLMINGDDYLAREPDSWLLRNWLLAHPTGTVAITMAVGLVGVGLAIFKRRGSTRPSSQESMHSAAGRQKEARDFTQSP